MPEAHFPGMPTSPSLGTQTERVGGFRALQLVQYLRHEPLVPTGSMSPLGVNLTGSRGPGALCLVPSKVRQR